MNHTKWNELFKAFYRNECDGNIPLVRWRTKDLENGFISEWDGTWTHFGCEPKDWAHIDYLQIELTRQNRDFVLQEIKRIHVPGTSSKEIVTIYGYRQDADYII